MRNPETGKMIKVNGPTYKDLEKKGHKMSKLSRSYSLRKKYPIHSDKPVSPKQLKKMSSRTTSPSMKTIEKNAREPSMKRRAREQMRRAGESRGSDTRGWAALSPKKGKERNELMKQCGSRCFLSPKDKAFPICPKCLKGKDGKKKCECATDCRAVVAAKVRAKEWKYDHIAEAADKLDKKLKCSRGSPKKSKKK